MVKLTGSDCFQLKADFLPITVLRFLRADIRLFKEQLENIVLKAPQYFNSAPVIVDFTEFSGNQNELDMTQISNLLKQFNMQLIAARGLVSHATLPILTTKPQKTESIKIAENKIEPRSKTILITKPVRAGTQVYAKNADLIILSSVNAGAEIIADGNIHIYGPLRGRALAGASGDIEARIFCQDLKAELIAIAGHYLVNEKLKMPKSKLNSGLLQICLENEQLKIEII